MDEAGRQQQLQKLWEYVTNAIKRQIINPTIWMAMEAAKPLTLEGNLLVLGIDLQNYNLASHLEQAGTRTAIQQHLSVAARGQAITYQVIQGETIADWEEIKEREKMVREMAAQPQAVSSARASSAPEMRTTDTWEDVVINAQRTFQALTIKNVPQVRARYILTMMPLVAEAEMKITGGEGATEDRGLAHVLDKIAQLTETDSVVVALEYLKYRQSQKPAVTAKEDGAE